MVAPLAWPLAALRMTTLWRGRGPAPEAPLEARPIAPSPPCCCPSPPRPQHPVHCQNKPQKRICFSFLPPRAGPHGAKCIFLLSLLLSEGKTRPAGSGPERGAARVQAPAPCSLSRPPRRATSFRPKRKFQAVAGASAPLTSATAAMDESCPPKCLCWSPTSSVTVFGDVAFTGQVIRVK